jgi:NhaP-type Na+/H+ or K+/H+ antiporter
MLMYAQLALIAVFVFVYSAIAGGLEKTQVNGAMVFTAFGLIFGPLGFGLLSLDIEAEGIRKLAELTLALVLFTDASNANLAILKKNIGLPRRLLLLGLPLTILLGYVFGIVIFDELRLLEVALVATMLAPTDAALGKAVVTDESVPGNIRESLNVESGLNDGICVPILFVFLALAVGTSTDEGTTSLAVRLVAEDIGIGVAVGVTLTYFGVALVRLSAARGWVTRSWRQLPVVALAFACFALAQTLGGSGFIAAFCGGLFFGWLGSDKKHPFLLAAEGTGDTFALLTWVVFGCMVVGPAFHTLSWQVVLYALLSLTVIRMLPVFIVLWGTNLRISDKLFIGWFGPRGLASIVFGVIVLGENLPGSETIKMAAISTITLSVVLHGLTAKPFIAALAARENRASRSDESI